jgi:hypothetical protein
MSRHPPFRLLLEIDVGERLPVGVADDEAGVGLLDGPGRREAALHLGFPASVYDAQEVGREHGLFLRLARIGQVLQIPQKAQL